MANFRATFTGLYNNAINCQNVVVFDDGNNNFTDLQVATELRDNWLTLIKAGQVTTFAWRNISIERIGSGVAPLNLAVNVQGVDSVDNLGGTQVICVKWRIHTTFPGKKGRGRIFLPAFRSVYWSAGQLTSLGITNISGLITTVKNRYVGPGSSGPLKLGVRGRGASDSGFHAADDITLSITPGVQRRRNLGVGI